MCVQFVNMKPTPFLSGQTMAKSKQKTAATTRRSRQQPKKIKSAATKKARASSNANNSTEPNRSSIKDLEKMFTAKYKRTKTSLDVIEIDKRLTAFFGKEVLEADDWTGIFKDAQKAFKIDAKTTAMESDRLTILRRTFTNRRNARRRAEKEKATKAELERRIAALELELAAESRELAAERRRRVSAEEAALQLQRSARPLATTRNPTTSKLLVVAGDGTTMQTHCTYDQSPEAGGGDADLSGDVEEEEYLLQHARDCYTPPGSSRGSSPEAAMLGTDDEGEHNGWFVNNSYNDDGMGSTSILSAESSGMLF